MRKAQHSVLQIQAALLSEEIPQTQAERRTQPELWVSFKRTLVPEGITLLPPSRMSSALSALLPRSEGGGSSIAQDRRLRSNLIGEEAKLNKGLEISLKIV